MDILQTAETLTTQPRAAAHAGAALLAEEVFRVENATGITVSGEEGRAYPGAALERLVTGHFKREGGGPVSQLEAWMQAEVVTAGVAATHELQTGIPVTAEAEYNLRLAFTAFGTQPE